MASVDCQCCGHALQVPDDLPERSPFSCGHCGLVLRNVEAARGFRWKDVDPYVRRHGATPANLWGGLIGSLSWLPVLGVVMVVKGRLDVWLLAAVGVPYLLLLAVMKARRARTPAALWVMELWAGLGAFLVYLRALTALFPAWAGDLLDPSGETLTGPTLGVLGVVWMVVGVTGALLYRRRARGLPVMHGPPPEAASEPDA
jgi:hypothetical protein